MVLQWESIIVLVVEDDEFQRAVLRLQLEDLGVVRVGEAGGGRAALERVAAGDPVDVVICDLDMPDIDGMAFIRRLAECRDPPAIVVSSAADEAIVRSVRAMSVQLGLRMLGSVPKPPTPEVLREVLARHARPEQPDGARELPEPTVAELHDAFRDGHFVAHYQPKVDLGTGAVRGAEALVRWRHAVHGELAAGHFVGAIERHGLSAQLADAVLEAAAQAAARWSRAGLHFPVAVNLPADILRDPGLGERLVALAQRHGLAPGRFVLEITESAAMRDIARSLETLSRLRLRGFGLSIDDFGKGYSSLQRLSRVPYTELKIDQAFVTGSGEAPHLRAMMAACVEIAHSLGLSTVAEGVETPEDLEAARTCGCEMGQGWLFARPMDAEAILEWAHGRP